MQDEQRQTYQAFFRNNDGKLKGRIAHKTTDHEQFPEMDFGKVDDVADVPALRFTLAENMAFWAHTNNWSRLPGPLPLVDKLPSDHIAIGSVEVSYRPD